MNSSYYRAGVLSLCLVVGGCSSPLLDETESGGSGGGIGGSGVTGVTDYSVGTLTGFGSVFINGNRFDTATSEFIVNGRPAAQNQLRVGMQLTAEVDFESAAATQIDYAALLIGPVSTAPDAMGQLRVLNQPVFIAANTVLDSLVLEDVVSNQILEISGVTNASGTIVASYIRPAPNSRLQIAGTVSTVDDGQQRITVRDVTILLEQADQTALNGMPLLPGTPVIVEASANQFDASTNTLAASFIAPGTAITPAEDARIELAGFVQTLEDSTSFTVDGIKITTTNLTQYQSVDGTALEATTVSVNSLIEVEGRFSSTGVVDAQRVLVLPDENSELVGQIESVDTLQRSVTILGVPVRTTSLTRFRGDDSSAMNFDSLRVGDYAEIDAAFTSSGLLATKIEIDDIDDEASLEGPVTRIDTSQRRVEIVGVSIFYDDDTDLEIEQNGDDLEMDEQSFINALSVGTIVKATWETFSNITVPVDELEIK